MVLQYGDNKEIELYDSPRIAIVDGQSGCWDYGGLADIRYEIHYGDKQCVISTTKRMIYFGDVLNAMSNWKDEEKWISYREKRIQ